MGCSTRFSACVATMPRACACTVCVCVVLVSVLAMKSLIVEPMICVHDALVAQARVEDDLFARRKLREWFAGEVECAGLKLVIPVDGAVAQDWSMKGGGKI